MERFAPVSSKILKALAALTASGDKVIFASARPIRDMLPVIREDFHSYTMFGGNGSLILKMKGPFFQNHLSIK